MRLDIRVKYQCGCAENVRIDIPLPSELVNTPRTPENDRDPYGGVCDRVIDLKDGDE